MVERISAPAHMAATGTTRISFSLARSPRRRSSHAVCAHSPHPTRSSAVGVSSVPSSYEVVRLLVPRKTEVTVASHGRLARTNGDGARKRISDTATMSPSMPVMPAPPGHTPADMGYSLWARRLAQFASERDRATDRASTRGAVRCGSRSTTGGASPASRDSQTRPERADHGEAAKARAGSGTP